MKSALLERPEVRAGGIAAGALGEDEDALAGSTHLVRGAGEGEEGLVFVGAVDEDGAREDHEPAEEGDPFEGALGRHAAVVWPDGAEEEDVERGLVVADQDGRTHGVEVFGAGDDFEAGVGCVAHGPFEGAGGGPLGEAVVAEEAEEE